MKNKIAFVQKVLGFMFEESFEKRLAELGYPEEDLDIWFKNAQVFKKVTENKPISEHQAVNLVTLIESIRFEAMCRMPPGIECEFDTSAYEFSKDSTSDYKQRVIDEVLKQENS